MFRAEIQSFLLQKILSDQRRAGLEINIGIRRAGWRVVQANNTLDLVQVDKRQTPKTLQAIVMSQKAAWARVVSRTSIDERVL